jgi:hypothetical protein
MAGQPKRRALVQLLATRAKSELGEEAGPVDWVCHMVAQGFTMRQIADMLAPSLGGLSRNYFSSVANHLGGESWRHIERARRHRRWPIRH